MAPGRRSSKRVALQSRDAGLRKIAIATRLLVVGSVGASAAFTALAAWAQPGHAKSRVSTAAGRLAAAPSAPGNGGSANGSGSSDDGSLSPPANLPVPNYQYSPPAAVSGAS